MSRQKATMSNIEGRRLANDVHMDRSEWILAARRTLKELCREIERLRDELDECRAKGDAQ